MIEPLELRSLPQTYFRDRFVQHSFSISRQLRSRPDLERLEREKSDLRQHLRSLSEENSKIRQKVDLFKKKVLKLTRECRSEPTVVDVAADAGWIATSEMLASLELQQLEAVSSVMSGELTSTAELVQRAGLTQAMQLVSLLGQTRTAVVIGDQIFPTRFGRSVVAAVSAAYEKP